MRRKLKCAFWFLVAFICVVAIAFTAFATRGPSPDITAVPPSHRQSCNATSEDENCNRSDDIHIENDDTGCVGHTPVPVLFLVVSRDEGAVVKWDRIPAGGQATLSLNHYPMDALLLVYVGVTSVGWKLLWSDFLLAVHQQHRQTIVRAFEAPSNGGSACVFMRGDFDCCRAREKRNLISDIDWEQHGMDSGSRPSLGRAPRIPLAA
jgi:hypothetical protein